MAGPLDGLDLGPPTAPAAAPDNQKKPPVETSGPLAGIDLSASTAPAAPPAAPPRDYQSPSWLPGAGYLRKVSNSFDDTFTGHTIDPATAKVGELLRNIGISNTTPDAATLHAQTVQDRADTPVGSALADVGAYATGFGKLGLGEAATQGAAKVLPGWLSRMAGQGVENATFSGLSSAGSGNSWSEIAKDTGVGGLIGALTGALPGGGGPKPTTPSTADLQSNASSLYAPLKNKVYQTPTVESVINNVNVPQGLQSKMSSDMSNQIDKIKGIVAKGGQTTADDIADFRASLSGAAKNSTDQTIANQYIAALDRGVGTNTANDIKAANSASGVAKTSSDIDAWTKMTQRNPGKVPDAVNDALTNNPNFYGNARPMLQEVADAQPGLGSKILGKVGGGLIGAGVEGGVDYITGKNPWAGAASGGLTGLLLGHAAGKVRAANLANQLAATQHFNATGMKLDPAAFASNAWKVPGMLARTVGGALGVSNPLDWGR